MAEKGNEKNPGGSQKKSRSFDVMAMFEEARKTAIERSYANPEKQESEVPSTNIKISDSGSSFSSDSSDSESENDQNTKISVADSVKDRKTSESLKKISISKTDNDDDGDDMIGPPLPPGFAPVGHVKSEEETIGPPVSLAKHDSDEEDSEEEEETLEQKIPSSHEITLNHGVKTFNR